MKEIAIITAFLVAMTATALAQLNPNSVFPINPAGLGAICPGFGALCQPLPAALTPCGNGTLDFSTACGTTFYLLGVT